MPLTNHQKAEKLKDDFIITFKSDGSLDLSNILKNAIEASQSGDNISISTSSVNDMFTIAIHNLRYISYEIQLQIFQSTFSTKGDGRGLGTYSIKLLIEQYLHGSVRFRSLPQEVTTFFDELPPSII